MRAVVWLFYALGSVVWTAYSLLAFISKPGTRRLLPFAFLAVSALAFPRLDAWIFGLTGDTSHIGAALVTMVVIALLSLAYTMSSRFLSLLLSVFPPIRRPIRPVAPIARQKRLDEPVPVQIAVPPIGRR